jgi:hypothetical protein
VTTATASGDGAANAVTSIKGTTATKLLWPENSIPNTFTVCSVTRYTGGTRGPILSCEDSPTQDMNWHHGHWSYPPDAGRGVAYYNTWIAPHTARTSVEVLDDWLVMCGTNAGATTPGNIILDQDEIGAVNGGSGGCRVSIGYNVPFGASDWALHSLLIWDYSLGTVPVPWHTRPYLSNLVAGSVDVDHSMMRFRDAWNCLLRDG